MSRREDIDNEIWHDPDFTALSADARYLYLWTFTNPRCNMAGLYKLALEPIPVETGLSMKRVRDALTGLSGGTFAYYEDGVLWVRSRVSHLRSTNPNMAKAIARDVSKIRNDHPLRIAFLTKYRVTPWLKEALSSLPLVEPNSETVTEPLPDRLPTVQGKGKGIGTKEKVVKEGDWESWLSHFHATTGRTRMGGSEEAQSLFNARLQDYSLDDLKLATLGCHSDDYLRENALNRPETILRASNVERYIEKGQALRSAPEVQDYGSAREAFLRSKGVAA